MTDNHAHGRSVSKAAGSEKPPEITHHAGNGHAKLTDADRVEIRRLYAETDPETGKRIRTMRQVGAMFGVTAPAVSHVINGRAGRNRQKASDHGHG